MGICQVDLGRGTAKKPFEIMDEVRLVKKLVAVDQFPPIDIVVAKYELIGGQKPDDAAVHFWGGADHILEMAFQIPLGHPDFPAQFTDRDYSPLPLDQAAGTINIWAVPKGGFGRYSAQQPMFDQIDCPHSTGNSILQAQL